MTRLTRLSLAVSGLILAASACQQRIWREVSSLEMGAGRPKLMASKQIRLEPTGSNPVAMPGSLLSSSKFKFSGTYLDAGSDRDLKTAVTYKSMSGEGSVAVVTLTGTAIRWRRSEKQREIEIAFAATEELTGKGTLYFYMVASDGSCVSNIVQWPIEFRP